MSSTRRNVSLRFLDSEPTSAREHKSTLMWGWRSSRTFVIVTAEFIFAVCCILPVACFYDIAGRNKRSWRGAVLDARQRTLLYNTTLLGVGAAVLSTAIGAPLGIALARATETKGRDPRRACRTDAAAALRRCSGLDIPLDQRRVSRGPRRPRHCASWTHSLPAAILVLSLVFYPLSMLASEVGLRRIDGRLEEAALVVAAPRRVLRRITLPLAAPSIVAAALVIFVLAVSEFGVPGLLRVRVYTTEIFTAFAALDFSRAIVLAVPLLVLSAAVGAVAAQLLGDRIVSARRLTGRHPALFDHWRREARRSPW